MFFSFFFLFVLFRFCNFTCSLCCDVTATIVAFFVFGAQLCKTNCCRALVPSIFIFCFIFTHYVALVFLPFVVSLLSTGLRPAPNRWAQRRSSANTSHRNEGPASAAPLFAHPYRSWTLVGFYFPFSITTGRTCTPHNLTQDTQLLLPREQRETTGKVRAKINCNW